MPEDQVRTTVNDISSRSLGAGDGGRKAMPPLLREQFSSSASWPWRTWRDSKISSDKEEDEGEGSNSTPEGEKEEEREELSQTGSSDSSSLNRYLARGHFSCEQTYVFVGAHQYWECGVLTFSSHTYLKDMAGSLYTGSQIEIQRFYHLCAMDEEKQRSLVGVVGYILNDAVPGDSCRRSE